MKTIGLSVLTLLLPIVVYAQNPCTVPGPTVVQFNPTKLLLTLPEHTTMEADGTTPRVNDYQVQYIPQGQDPNTAMPIAGPTAVPKTAFSLVTGTPDCYLAGIPIPVPAGTVALVASLKSRRTASGNIAAAESTWSVVSNPFAVAPSALAAPGRAIVSR